MHRARIVCAVAAIVVASGSLFVISTRKVSAQVASPSVAGIELLQVLGEGVVGEPESARTLSHFSTLARWQTGEWRYRITSGARRGETGVEDLTPIGSPPPGGEGERRT